MVADKRAGDEWLAAQDAARPVKYLAPQGVVEQVNVAGVHIDGRRQTGVGGASDVGVEGIANRRRRPRVNGNRIAETP